MVERKTLLAVVVVVILVSTAAAYTIGRFNTLEERVTTSTVTSTHIEETTTTTTVFRTINGSELDTDVSRLIFLGSDTLMMSFRHADGYHGEQFYRYVRFPYQNFTFDGFGFAYREGECKEVPAERIQILPCGSHLLVEFPSYGWNEIPSQTDHLVSQEYFQWSNMALSVVNGEVETAGLLLVVGEDGSRTVYVVTQR
jgi:hypothetical protein